VKLSVSSATEARRCLIPLLIVLLLLSPNASAQQPPSPATTPTASLPTVQNLKILPLAGNGEQNDLERRVMAPLVIQVLDQNQRPIEGADVVFRFPLNGPSATFANGQTSQSTKTNSQGQAAAKGWVANNQAGTFQVQVTATYGNQFGAATISMENVTGIVEGQKARRKHRSPWLYVAIIAGVAGLVTGIVLATTGGSGNNGKVIISPGSPTVGGPQ
jgi:hypothetical protein